MCIRDSVTTQQPQVALLVLSYNSKIALIEPNCDGSFFHTVSAIECIAKKASAPLSALNVPDIFCFIFSFLIPLSLAIVV